VIRNSRDVLTGSAPPPDLTLRYGEDENQVADVRLPPPDVPAASMVIFVHGGFWRAEYDRTHAGLLSADLASRGSPVVTVEYRRVGQPGGGWPGTFSDVAAAVAAVPGLLAGALAHRGRPPVDTDRPVLAGHSAGGQLALWYAAVAPDAVGGVVALAPVADLVEGYRRRLGDGAVAALLGGDPDSHAERYRSADPMMHLPLKVRTVIVHGTEDGTVPVELARGYAASAHRAGDDCTLVELPGVEHFAVIDPLSPAWPAVLDAFTALGAARWRHPAPGPGASGDW
jgi:acetyl esterase/lipase